MRLVRAERDHRLDGDDETRLHLGEPLVDVLVVDRWILVQLTTHTVARVAVDDLEAGHLRRQPREAPRSVELLEQVLYALTDVVEALAHLKRLDAGPHRRLGREHESAARVALRPRHDTLSSDRGLITRVTRRHALRRARVVPRRPDDERQRRVAVPPVDDRSAIERDDVAVLQHALPRDAMDHLVVDGDAQRRGKAVVPEERRRRTAFEHVGVGDGVDVLRRHARARSECRRAKRRAGHETGPAHRADVVTRLEIQSGASEHQFFAATSSRAALMRASTSSIEPMPSTWTRRPRSV